MDGQPEGTTARRRRISPWWTVTIAVFAVYLLFRLGQGVVWLVQHV